MSPASSLASGARAAALYSLLAAVVLLAFVLQASGGAPAKYERHEIRYDDPPGEVARDAILNLYAGEYTHDVRVRDTGDRADVGPLEGTGFEIRGDGPRTTVRKHDEIDNPARRYRSWLRFPVLEAGAEQRFRVHYYAEGPVGRSHGPEDTGTWRSRSGLAYTGGRNPLTAPREMATAAATVRANNDSAYVVRIEDDRLALDVAYPGTPSPVGFGSTRPPTDNATANLTLHVDKSRGVLVRAVLRYHHRVGDRYVEAVHEFTDHGDTPVSRPAGTLPPDPAVLVYRFDLGLWVLSGAPPRLLGLITVPLLWHLAAVRRRGEPP